MRYPQSIMVLILWSIINLYFYTYPLLHYLPTYPGGIALLLLEVGSPLYHPKKQKAPVTQKYTFQNFQFFPILPFVLKVPKHTYTTFLSFIHIYSFIFFSF